MNAPQLLDLDDLNLNVKCEQGFEFEYLDGNGNGTGFHITVLGGEAPKVQSWVRNKLNQRRAQEAMAAKRGKDAERTVEDDIDFGNEAAAIRIIGWRGAKQEYSPAMALQLVTMNSLVREQVLKASNDLGNFSKAN